MSARPPDQPNPQTTTATPKRMFHAVTVSCCPTEYAVAVAASVTPSRATTLTAWLIPTPPGVADTVLARELPPITHMTEWIVTGIPYAARNTAVTPSLASHAPSDGSATFRK